MDGIYWILGIHLAIVIAFTVVAIALFRRRRRVAALVALLAIPLAMRGWYLLSAQPSIAAALYESDTQYAAGFKPDAFRDIRVGDTQTAVEQKLGRPLTTRESDEKKWLYYSRPGRKQSYWQKVIVLDRQTNRVVRIVDDFYRD